MPRRHRKMKGGFLDSLQSTLSSFGSTLSQGASSAWDKTKSASSSAYNYVMETDKPTNSYMPTLSSSNTSSYTMGGRKRTRKHMRGGFKDNTPTSGLAAHAAPISDVKNAQPHNWVGGKKTKKRHHKKHRNSKIKH